MSRPAPAEPCSLLVAEDDAEMLALLQEYLQAEGHRVAAVPSGGEAVARLRAEPFDVVVMGDVLEHVRHPGRLLADARKLLAPGGSMLISVPNFGHWYPRFRTALGAFDYDMRGILDRTHVRFFTRRSLMRLLDDANLRVVSFDQVGLPLGALAERSELGVDEHGEFDEQGPGVLAKAECALAQAWPTMFAYQFLVKAEPA